MEDQLSIMVSYILKTLYWGIKLITLSLLRLVAWYSLEDSYGTMDST